MQPQPQTASMSNGARLLQMVDRKNAEYTTYFTEDGQVVSAIIRQLSAKTTSGAGWPSSMAPSPLCATTLSSCGYRLRTLSGNQAVAVLELPDGSQVRLPVVTVINLTGEGTQSAVLPGHDAVAGNNHLGPSAAADG